MKNQLLSESLAIAAVIKPDAATANTYTSGWISMAEFGQILAVVMAGDLGTNATVDAKLQQATNASGAGAKDIAGKAVTQLTQAGTDKSNKQALINLRSEEIDRRNGFSHVRLSVTVATATSDLAAVVLGTRARYSPVVQSAAVDQVVA